MLESVIGVVTYQSEAVPKSLLATGKVYINRDADGSDERPVGCDPVEISLTVSNARLRPNISLDKNGFQLYDHAYEHINYCNEEEVVNIYYSICEEFIKRETGARRVVAFDHNVRSAQKNSWMNKDGSLQTIKNNKVQSPALVVHNDYTMTSAPLRLQLLAGPPKVNDTWVLRTNGAPLIDPNEIGNLMSKRYVFINLWRNISTEPVRDTPLGMCDATTFAASDLVTFEIKYPDRTGENYFASYTENHRWYYYPEATRNEALLLKVWDSAGALATGDSSSQRSTFSFHSAFKDPTTTGAPARESIEVRTIAFFD